MKKIASKKGIQKIAIAILIVLSFNFIMPSYSQADWGGTLGGPIIDFFASVGDAVLYALQYFMYDGGASSATSTSIADGYNQFNLPAAQAKKNPSILAQYGLEATGDTNSDEIVQVNADEFDKGWRSVLTLGTVEKDYYIPVIHYTPEAIFANRVPALDVNFINPTDWSELEDENGDPLYENGSEMNERSITQKLHSTIANWYVALRNLAIIALLSVLLYVGIRMVISSTASDKAKYKQMLMDWVVALCIVFFLHYIMSFILTVTDMITKGIEAGSQITVNIQDGSDNILFNTNLTGLCRLQLQYSNLGVRMIYLFFYLALVIYTAMFTWTYVKRAITMAFLTLMAPLVAITYPIDKMGDGKSQAFNIWLKEFIFNALLQPFHLIIYTIFLGSSMQIAAENPIWAILFLAFIIPAEKLLRKMFGFDKTSTTGGMSTAASVLGGAAVLKGAKGLLGIAGKAGGKSGAGGKGSVRTAKNAITDPNAPGKVTDIDFSNGTTRNNSELANDEKQTNKDNQLNNTNQTNNNLSDEENQEMNSLKQELDNADYNDMYMNQEAYSAKQDRLKELEAKQAKQQESQTTKNWRQRIRENFASDDNDMRGMGEWLKDGVGQTFSDGKNALMNTGAGRFVRKNVNRFNSIKTKAGNKYEKLPKPMRNTIRGAVGTAKRAAVGTAKFAGKVAAGAAIGGTIGLAAGIAGDDLEDVFRYGAAGAAMGIAGLPVLGRGMTAARGRLRSTYEEEAFGTEGAALREQTREKMADKEFKEQMDNHYSKIYGEKPTEKQSREYRKHAIEYYNSGITSTKEIQKSMKFEKELKERMMKEGTDEEEANRRAKQQAIVISKLASEANYETLTDEKKRNGLQERFFRELKAGGMDDKAATKNADYTVKLIMQRKGLNPD